MAEINLLPWREQLREERQKQFYTALVASMMLAAFVMVAVHMTISSLIAAQDNRNQYLELQIKQLDMQIGEIKNLRTEKEKLIARMNIIQELQAGRASVVHLFDEMVKLLPDGIYFESIKREGNIVTITGKAESNSDVSKFMRQIDGSSWIDKPALSEIKTLPQDAQYKSAFKMQFVQKSSNPIPKETAASGKELPKLAALIPPAPGGPE